ncbi:Uncharacterised protein (plasmid) [Legionella adelaidensis]|uniref:Tfp pilus assembly protein PilX n=1 Tax=Legionella adelaidensis TaxID=45056 RepID=A0A0W0R1F3_9GAMM|nr:hypothetical protein [Legionella adelaidensis]KTC64932.1 hypothetical protein Lade_1739 [Legionella adelaidensis]VEH85615.1 Uncharacterised protein [Legionella adelaidensis]
MNNKRGFVLLICIVLIFSIATFTLASLQNIFLFTKTINQIDRDNENFYYLEAKTLQLIAAFKKKNLCYSNLINPNTIFSELENRPCKMGKVNYLFTDLGVVPCLQMKVNGRVNGTHHWLITSTNYQSFLQIRFATSVPNSVCMEPHRKLITTNILSWRFITQLPEIRLNKQHENVVDL